MSEAREMVVPEAMLPYKGTQRVKGEDGKDVILRNDGMFTFYQFSMGEFSEFFINIADHCRILGAFCPSCGVINCPPYQKRCPECNFVEMETVTMQDVGRMNYVPVITLFPPARFKGEVPFGTGYVFLGVSNKEADTALPIRARTTRGMIRPGIYGTHEPVKVVFKDERNGEITDIFVVPQAELTSEQIKKTPLMESDLDWEGVKEPEFVRAHGGRACGENFDDIYFWFRKLGQSVNQSENAKKALADWVRIVDIKTASFRTLRLFIISGTLRVSFYANRFGPLVDREADLVLAIEDPKDLFQYFERGVALSNLVMEGKLWVSKAEFETIFRLDRLPRALQRDGLWPLK